MCLRDNTEILVANDDIFDISNQSIFIRSEWVIKNKTVYQRFFNKICYLEYIFELKRKSSFYGKIKILFFKNAFN